jgi:hypothetical protein
MWKEVLQEDYKLNHQEEKVKTKKNKMTSSIKQKDKLMILK